MRLDEFASKALMLARLEAAGLPTPTASGKAEIFRRLARRLLSEGVSPSASTEAYFVPGRIEVLGKHTDYAGGRSLVASVERGFCLIVLAREDPRVAITDHSTGERADFGLAPDLDLPRNHWTRYPMTVARRIARDFPVDMQGAEIVFASDLPPASGMSSSSALVIAVFMALSGVNLLSRSPEYARQLRSVEDLAGYLGALESGQGFGEMRSDLGVGTFGGSEDHTAILCSTHSELGQFSYCPVRLQRRVSLPSDLRFVLAFSGIAAPKMGSARGRYNRLSLLASAAIELWQVATDREDPHLAAALASSPGAGEEFVQILQRQPHSSFGPQELSDRLEHFQLESEEIVPGVPDRLATDKLDSFGVLVDRSQALAERLLGNQIPETVHLARDARQLGAAAASAFGAGFGGSVWALVRDGDCERFQESWATRYAARFPDAAIRSSFFSSSAGPGAFQL